MAHDVFISYPSEDKPLADAICAKLESNGIRCWIAPRDILPGQKYAEALLNAIDICKIFILVFSQNANTSPHIMSEVQRAFNNNRIILPFRIENIEPSKALEYYIGSAHWLDAITPPIEAQIDTLVRVVKINLETPIDEESIITKQKRITAHPIIIPDRSKFLYPAIIAILALIAIGLFLNPLLIQGSSANNPPVSAPSQMSASVQTSVPTSVPTPVPTSVPTPVPTSVITTVPSSTTTQRLLTPMVKSFGFSDKTDVYISSEWDFSDAKTRTSFGCGECVVSWIKIDNMEIGDEVTWKWINSDDSSTNHRDSTTISKQGSRTAYATNDYCGFFGKYGHWTVTIYVNDIEVASGKYSQRCA